MDDIVAARARDVDAWRVAVAGVADGADAVASAVTAASRSAGRGALALTAGETARMRDLGIVWPLTRWAVDDFARATLLAYAAQTLDARAMQGVVSDCYARGDVRQRQAILRALPLLPVPERFLAPAADAARSAVPALFEAIACENPYPAAHFPITNFNHMVVTALRTGLSLDRILGLGPRVTPDLGRLAKEWVAERRSASRSVPAALGGLIAA